MMPHQSHLDRPEAARQGRMVRPEFWRPPDRHILLGVSHASNDPARHRTFEIRASYDVDAGGWIARAGEQNLNEQPGAWARVDAGEDPAPRFQSAAECLGHAVTSIIAAVDQEAAGRH